MREIQAAGITTLGDIASALDDAGRALWHAATVRNLLVRVEAGAALGA
jgi:hypothetical protein